MNILCMISVVMTAVNAEMLFMDKLVANDRVSGDNFGRSVCISDGHAIVGAYLKGNDSGAAYIFSLDNTTKLWNQTAKLVAHDGASGDYFGLSVSISGGQAIVGSEQNNGKGDNSGVAYIFSLDHMTKIWNQTAKLMAKDGASSDYFGRSVSISDGHAIVGAYLKGNDSGAAYIFSLDNVTKTWNQTAKLVAHDGASGDRFGLSVSISGGQAIVGSEQNNGKGDNSGVAYIFSLDHMTKIWNQTAKLMAKDGAS
eukprot:437282_1